MKDERTLAQLAQEALDIQDACNVSGLVFGWARCMLRFNELVKSSTEDRNTHPIHVLWSDKLASLTGAQHGMNYTEKYHQCLALATGTVAVAAAATEIEQMVSDAALANEMGLVTEENENEVIAKYKAKIAADYHDENEVGGES